MTDEDHTKKRVKRLRKRQLDMWVKRLTKEWHKVTTMGCIEYGDLLIEFKNSGARGKQFEEAADRVVGLKRSKAYKLVKIAKSPGVRRIAHRLVISGEGWYTLYLIGLVEKANGLPDFEAECMPGSDLVEIKQGTVEEFNKRYKVANEESDRTETTTTTAEVSVESPPAVQQTAISSGERTGNSTASLTSSSQLDTLAEPNSAVELTPNSAPADEIEAPTIETASFAVEIPVKTPEEKRKVARCYYELADELPTGSKIKPNKVVEAILQEHPKCLFAFQTGTTDIAHAASRTVS